MRIREPDHLPGLAAEAHDAYLDLDRVSLVDGVLTAPISRGETRRFGPLHVTRMGTSARWDAQLVVRGVTSYRIDEDQGIGAHTIRGVAWDAATRQLRIAMNEVAVVIVDATSLDIELAPVPAAP